MPGENRQDVADPRERDVLDLVNRVLASPPPEGPLPGFEARVRARIVRRRTVRRRLVLMAAAAVIPVVAAVLAARPSPPSTVARIAPPPAPPIDRHPTAAPAIVPAPVPVRRPAAKTGQRPIPPTNDRLARLAESFVGAAPLPEVARITDDLRPVLPPEASAKNGTLGASPSVDLSDEASGLDRPTGGDV